jgi:flavin reductase (DIM6/NTAB) family NADH-FMN oxidoreductase RutF
LEVLFLKIEIPLSKFYDFFMPTPVVLVSTMSKDGIPNLAPFGLVIPISFNPPMIALGIRDNRKTHKNIMETKEFVVNLPSTDQVKLVNKSAEPCSQINKFERVGLTPLQSVSVKTPSIKECKVHFECTLEWTKNAGDHTVIVGKVVAISVDDDLPAAEKTALMDKMGPLYYGLMTYYDLGKVLVERKNLS